MRRSCRSLPRPRCRRKIFRCATTSACSGAFSATRCGIAGGRRGLRPRRAHPPDRDPLPPRRGPGGALRAGGHLLSLSRAPTIQIIRAFSYFSHLANIAEDQHHIRRTRAHAIAGSTPREGTLGPRSNRLEAGIGRAELARLLRRGPDLPGADRASDRSPAQEHARPRERDRRAAGAARPHGR